MSPSNPVSDLLRVKAANISIPGAAISGYIPKKMLQTNLIKISISQNQMTLIKSYTLRRRVDPGLGPLDEKEATNGAGIVTCWVF